MREQLGRLLEAGEQPNVTLQVLPFGVGAHAAMLGAFVILGFAGPDQPVVYLETDTSSLYREEAAEIDRYTLIFDHLRAAALSPQESAAFVSQVRRELHEKGGRVTDHDVSRAIWCKNSYSGGTGGNCVEVARNLPHVVAVRDAQDPHGPRLVFTASARKAFTAEVKTGRYDMS